MMEANLYLDKMDVCRYWPAGVPVTCQECIAKLKTGQVTSKDFDFLTPGKLQALKAAIGAETYLPSAPLLTVPQPVEAGLFPVNEPDENSLVIVSGNNQITFEVLATVWAQGVTPAYFLLIDCLGNTVDMAMVYGDFTPVRLVQALQKSGLEKEVEHRRMIVPGLTAPLAGDFAAATGWEVEVGPVCAAEIPLFLGDRWVFPDT
jgi:hypothetical protein